MSTLQPSVAPRLEPVQHPQGLPWWLRLLATSGTPILAGLLWYAGYTVVYHSGEAPHGDTAFAWMPLALGVVPVAALFGLMGLLARTRGATLALGGVLGGGVVVLLFAAVPDYGASEGFPATAGTQIVMTCGALLALLPLAATAAWPRRLHLVLLGATLLSTAGAIAVMVVLGPNTPPVVPDVPCSGAENAILTALVSGLTPAVDSADGARGVVVDGRCSAYVTVQDDGPTTTAAVTRALRAGGYTVTSGPGYDPDLEQVRLTATGPGLERLEVVVWPITPDEGPPMTDLDIRFGGP